MATRTRMLTTDGLGASLKAIDADFVQLFNACGLSQEPKKSAGGGAHSPTQLAANINENFAALQSAGALQITFDQISQDDRWSKWPAKINANFEAAYAALEAKNQHTLGNI